MKKYALYAWHSDDSHGIDVCYAKDFSPYKGYDVVFGPNTRPSQLITEFDSLSEAANAYVEYFGLLEDEFIDEVMEEIKYRLYCFHDDNGEYEEAQKYE